MNTSVSMKDAVTIGVKRIIAKGIIAQQRKSILIHEVVRIVFDEDVGINIFPPAKDPQEHHDRKFKIGEMLNNLYDQYHGQYASVRDVVTDLLSEAEKQHLTIIVR